MYKIELSIDGMMCGMCEAHISDVIRKVCGSNAKVTASHSEGSAQIMMDGQPDVARLKAAIKETGYKVTRVCCYSM